MLLWQLDHEEGPTEYMYNQLVPLRCELNIFEKVLKAPISSPTITFQLLYNMHRWSNWREFTYDRQMEMGRYFRRKHIQSFDDIRYDQIFAKLGQAGLIGLVKALLEENFSPFLKRANLKQAFVNSLGNVALMRLFVPFVARQEFMYECFNLSSFVSARQLPRTVAFCAFCLTRGEALNISWIPEISKLNQLCVADNLGDIQQFSPDELNHIDGSGRTVLMYALQFCSLPTIKKLLTRNPNPYLRDAVGHTALDFARQHQFGQALTLIQQYSKFSPDRMRWIPRELKPRLFEFVLLWKRLQMPRELRHVIIGHILKDDLRHGFVAPRKSILQGWEKMFPDPKIQWDTSGEMTFSWGLESANQAYPLFPASSSAFCGLMLGPHALVTAKAQLSFPSLKPMTLLLEEPRQFPAKNQELQCSPSAIYEYLLKVNSRPLTLRALCVVLAGHVKNPDCPLSKLPYRIVMKIVNCCRDFWPCILPYQSSVVRMIGYDQDRAREVMIGWEDGQVLFFALGARVGAKMPFPLFWEKYREAFETFPLRYIAEAEQVMLKAVKGLL
jgi:hypothetical protein